MHVLSKRIAALGLILFFGRAAFGQTMEVWVDGAYLPMDKAVVPTSRPLVRLTLPPQSFSLVVTRPDGRAGLNGTGKTVSLGSPGSGADLEETGVGTGVFVGQINLLPGLTTARLRDFGGFEVLADTMLCYSTAFEDVNENGITDFDEDIDGNGLLSPGEDLNNNQLLDGTEDANETGIADVGEDLNSNGLLDEGEDRNGNGLLDNAVALPVDVLIPDAETVHPFGFEVHPQIVQVVFIDGTTNYQISQYFQNAYAAYGVQLLPSGVAVDDMTSVASLEIIAEILDGTPPYEVARRLNGQSPGNYTFPPAAPPPPLLYAVSVVSASMEIAAGERLPARLINANVAPNNAPAGQGYAVNTGGFDDSGTAPTVNEDGDGASDEDALEAIVDNDGDGRADEDQTINGVDEDGDGADGEDPSEQIDNDGDACFTEDRATNVPADELDLFWNHLFMQTFAAEGLMRVLRADGQPQFPFSAGPRALGIVDSGFGNGIGAPADIAAARVVRPHNQAATVFNQGAPLAALLTGAAVNGGGAILWPRIADNSRGCPIALNRVRVHSLRHGTGVAGCSSATGTISMGTGPRTPIRPVRTTGATLPNALQTAATDPGTSVINLSWGFPAAAANAAAGAQRVVAARANFRLALQRIIATNKILVVAAGNTNESSENCYPAVFTSAAHSPQRMNPDGSPDYRINDDNDNNPDGTPRIDEEALDNVDNDGDGLIDEDLAEYAGCIAVSATGASNLPAGPERRARFSVSGPRILISAPGQDVNTLNPIFGGGGNYQFTGAATNGTSFAAPTIAGAISELTNYASGLPPGIFSGGAVTQAQRDRRVAQVTLLTSDDLGNGTGADGSNDFPNDDAGNGPDNHFGLGRLNMWKAALSIVNQGISAQHGRDDNGDSFDDRFTQIPVRADAATLWYGFEVVTSERAATVWIDGVQQADAASQMPNQPNITAFSGVRSDRRIDRGVHIQQDGSYGGDAAGPGSATDADPLTGVIPLGTRINDRGQYVARFSIRREDLRNGAQPRTLSLRKRGETVNAKPFFNLRLNTTAMRSGEVTGVVFDDYVFQVVAPDYGDAAIAPAKMNAENGPRHTNTALEWLGRPGATNAKSVTAEHNVETEATGGDATVDVDGVTNRRGFHDRDGRDDGVIFFPLTYTTGVTGKVQFQIGAADAGDPVRYDASVDRSVYFNLWIDWNADGVWSEDAADREHPLNGVRIQPRNANTWIIHSSGTTTATVNALVSTDNNVGRFECNNLPVGFLGCNVVWARARVDYGENVGRNDPRPLFRSFPSLRDPAQAPGDADPGANRGLVRGAARYGEVEDYLISSDLGDAPDSLAGQYPTLNFNNGATHLTTHMEWLGPPNATFPNVSRESDADEENFGCGGDPLEFGSDEDGHANLHPENTDLYDDGVVIQACPGDSGPVLKIDVTVTSSISARGGFHFFFPDGAVGVPEDPEDSLPRYVDILPNRMLYLSGWADWNGDGAWDNTEKIINDVVNPMLFGGDGQYTLGEPFTDTNLNGVRDGTEPFTDVFGVDSQTRNYLINHPTPGEDITDKVWFRFRLAYGEDDATLDLGVKEANATARNLTQAEGAALFGEVEDYVFERVDHDSCADPLEVSEGQYAFDTRQALYDGHTGGCGGEGPDVWFVYVPNCTGRAFISTCNNLTTFDTVLDVWDSDACPPAAVATVCNDDVAGCGNSSSVELQNVIAGQRYLIRVGGFAGACGTGILSIHCKSAGPRLYVNQAVVGGNGSGDSWANAIPRLEKAILLASNSYVVQGECLNIKEIWVAQGTYTPTPGTSRNATFNMISGVAIYGGFAGNENALEQRNFALNETILSGDLAGDDGVNFTNNAENSFHVVSALSVRPRQCDENGNMETRLSLLDGFIIEGGNADGDATNDVGGNVYIHVASPEIRNCFIRGGSATKNGGGVFVYCNPGDLPILKRCEINSNRVTGNCAECGGGGFYAERVGPTYVVNTWIFDNEAVLSRGGGVLLHDNNGSTLVNCNIFDNEATSGGGIAINQSPSPSIRNCTIRQNNATASGGGVYVRDSSSPPGQWMFANCILWDNTVNIAANAMAAEAAIAACLPAIDFSDVEGGFAAITLIGGANVIFGAGNINANPLFAGNGSIPGNSPCVNAGSNALIPADSADLNNNGNFNEAVPFDIEDGPRIRNVTVEMGAFEVPQPPANNMCPNPLPVGNGRTNFDNSGATTDGPLSCGTMSNDLWFCYTAPCNARVSISLCGSEFDTVLGVYQACVCPPTTQVACNDNCCDDGSSVSFVASAGATYLIQVGGANGATGAGVMDITCLPSPAIRYVNEAAIGVNNGTSWADAFTDLQTALQVAACTAGTPQQIWVATGTYEPAQPGGSRAATFQMLVNVPMYGGFAGFETSINQRNIPANPTILSGDLLGDDYPGFGGMAENAYHVVTASGTDPTAVLDGFIVTAGNADGAGSDAIGGGLLGITGSPVIRNCRFTNNSAVFGAVHFRFGSTPWMVDCEIDGNRAVGPSGEGAGAGLTLFTNASATIVNCRIHDNIAEQCGGGFATSVNSNAIFVNTTVLDNQGQFGAGGCIFQSNPQLLNVTLAGNDAGQYGGGLYLYESNVTAINAILWGNVSPNGAQVALRNCPSNIAVSYSSVQGGQPAIFVNPGCTVSWGAGNLTLNPLLDALGAPQAGSPVIDAGNNTAVPPDGVDLDRDGNIAERTPLDLARLPRFVNDPGRPDTGVGPPPICDMGAYEFQLSSPPPCSGDLDHDGDVDLADLSQLLSNFGRASGAVYEQGDLDGDQDVDLTDLAMLLSVFGTICP